jgi:hypothetical protein
VFDQSSVKGSAYTTTTVVVSDGTQTYTITRPNIFDDGSDIAYAIVADVDEMVTALQNVGANGIATPSIKSVRLESKISTARKLAEVVGVNVDGGLKHGTNKVVVSYLEWGNPATQTVDVPLSIPSSVPLAGTLNAYSLDGPAGDQGDMPSQQGEVLFDYDEEYGSEGAIDRSTVKQVVDELKRPAWNGELTVSFQPVDPSYDPEDEDGPVAPPKTYDPVSTSMSLDAYLVGAARMQAPVMDSRLSATTVSYNGATVVTGVLLGVDGSTGTVKITRQYAGESAVVTLGSVPLDADGVFSARLAGLKKNATFRLTYSGDADTLPTGATLKAKVRAKVSLKRSASKIRRGKSVTLTANVLPADTNGKVVFERYSRGRWRAVATRTVSGGKAAYKYRAPLGTNKLRARTTGSTINASGRSAATTVKVVR